MRILTNRQLNEIISRAKTEEWDKYHENERYERLERTMFEIERRLNSLERKGESPTLKKDDTPQMDCPWK